MTEKLLNHIMPNGDRHFAALPQTTVWYAVRDHVHTLPGAILSSFITDHVTEAWIDFTYHGYTFSINDQFGEYWFFVNDPTCTDDILHRVAAHWHHLLNSSLS